MLDRFPPELTNAVLDQLSSSRTKADAQQVKHTLYSCCLVSTYVSAVARPLLWRDIRLKGVSALHGFALSAGSATLFDLHRATRRLLIETYANAREALLLGAKEVEKVMATEAALLRLFPMVEDLHLASYGERVIGDVRTYVPNLVTLRLDFHTLTHHSTLILSRSLTSLTLKQLTIPSSVLPTLLSPASLPSLRALSFTTADNDSLGLLSLWHDLTTSYDIDRLDMVQLHRQDYRSILPAYSHLHDRVFLTSNGVIDYVPGVDHLRIFVRTDVAAAEKSLLRHLLAHHIQCHPTHQRSLHLPKHIHSGGTSPLTVDNPSGTVRTLVEACACAGVEIVWYDAEEEGEDEHGVSPSVWRYARGLKSRG